jgi:hypothetical protein
VKLDTGQADLDIAALKARLADIGNPNITPVVSPAGVPAVRIDAITDDADLKLADLVARIDATSAQIRVGLDPADADARIQILQSRLAGLASRSPVITPDVRITDAEAKLAALQAQLDSLKSETISPKVNSSGISQAGKAAEDTTGWMGLLIAAATAVAPVFITAGAGAALFGAAAIPALRGATTGTGELKTQVAALKNEYAGLALAVRPQVIDDANIAIGQAAAILPELTGAAKAGGSAVGGLFAQFGAFLQSGDTQQFLAFVSQEAGPDLHALGNVLTSAGGAVMALTQDINPLAKTLVSAAGGVLSFAGDVARSQPALVEWAAGAALAGFALVKLGEGFTAIKTSAFVTGVVAGVTAIGDLGVAATITAGTEALVAASADPVIAAWIAQVGAGEALTVVLGEVTASTVALAGASAALDLVSPWVWAVAAIAAVGALTYAAIRLTGSSQDLTAEFTAQYHATGYNIAGYREAAAALGGVTVAQRAAAGSAGAYRAGAAAGAAQSRQNSADYDTETGKLRNIQAALSSLERMYGVSQAGAIKMAESVKGSAAAFGEGGKAAQDMMDKVRGNAVAGEQDASVTNQLAVDMTVAADGAAALSDRVKALTAAYDALVSPLTSVIGDTVTWKNDNVSLATALRAAGDQTGYATAAQRAASQAMATSVSDTIALSEATLQNSGSAVKAAGILRQEIAVLEQLGAKGGVAAGLIARLRAELDALHSKTIQVNVNVAQTGGVTLPGSGGLHRVVAARGAVIPGYAPGHDSVDAKVSPGEAIMVPEWVRAVGSGNVMAMNRAYSGGRGNKAGQHAGAFAAGGLADSLFSGANYDQFNVYLSVAGAATDAGAAAGVVKGLKSASAVKSFQDTGRTLAEAFAGGSLKTLAQIKSEAATLMSDVQRYYSGAAQKRLTDALGRQTTALEHLAGQRQDIDKRLAAEKSYAGGITSGLAGYTTLSSLTAPAAGETSPALGASLQSQLAAKLATLRKFYALIGDLKRHGVSKAMIAQVVALGPDEGVQYAQAILSGGGKLISELNSEEQRIGALDTSIGRRATEIQYGQSISAGFLSGLKRQRAELDKEMARLGDQIAREVAKDFDVPVGSVRGLGGHQRHGQRHARHRDGRGTKPDVTINYYGTQHPTSEQKAAMMRDLALALSGAGS